MLPKLRLIFIFIIFTFFFFMLGLSISRHIFLGGSLAGLHVKRIIYLAEILPNIYHLMHNYTGVEGVFVPLKTTLNKKKFNVPGLYSYFTKSGWVIIDKGEKTKLIIPINWEKIKTMYYENCTNERCINSKISAAPTNPLKIANNLVFHLGGVLFKYNLKTKEFTAFKGSYHHSIEPFQDSLIYVCSFGKDTLGIVNDEITLLNVKSGELVYKKSIPNILLNNNLKVLLFGTTYVIPILKNKIHLNDIQPIRKNTNFAEKGDLLLSLRNLSTVLLYRPSVDSILWYSTGSWMNQHDVDVINDDMIGVYNNNVIRGLKFLNNTFTNISTYNFKTNKFETMHEQVFKKLRIQSHFSSTFEILSNGNMFVEDSPSGMYYLISKEGHLISSLNFPFDDKSTSGGQWARPYTFKKY